MEINRSAKSKRLVFAVAAAVVIVVGVAVTYFVTKQTPAPTQAAQNVAQTPAKTEPTKNIIHIAMMGDMLAHDSVNAQAKTADGYDYSGYFTKIKPLYSNADVVFCNPETVVAGDTQGVAGYPAFNAPSAFARDLVTKAGCNVINLASNHQGDRGQAAIDISKNIWKSLKPLAYNGMNSSASEQGEVSYFTVKGIRFAFVAFADFSNSALPHDYSVNLYHNAALVKQLMTAARQNADVVLVSAHWGTEDSSTINADQKTAAQMFADNGADMIIGTGPHVEQAVKNISSSDGRSVPVWYSIGNMLSSQLDINELTSGVAQCDIALDNKKVVVSNLSFDPTFMSYDWPAADKAAGKLTTRTNLTLQPLSEAEKSVQSMFGTSHSVAERRAYLSSTLEASTAGVTVR